MNEERRKKPSLGFDQTQVMQPVNLSSRGEMAEKIPTLLVLRGADEGRTFRLNQATHSLGRDPGTQICLGDQTVSRKHCLLVNAASGVTLIDLQSFNGTYVNDLKVEKKKLKNGDKITIGHTVLKYEITDGDISEYQEKLYQQITFDDLTSLYNRKYMARQLKTMFSSLSKFLPFSLLFIDIDHFKKINDTHGHLTGSKVLSDLGRLMLSNLRSRDYACRYGGEEFVIILSGSTARAAAIVAEKIRKLIAGHIFHTAEDQPIQLTVSIGAVEANRAFTSPQELISRADEAMYWAKENGRNISVLFRMKDHDHMPGFEEITVR